MGQVSPFKGVAELDVIQDAVARPVVVSRHGVVGVVCGADRPIRINMSVGTKYKSDKNRSADYNRSGNHNLNHIKFLDTSGRLMEGGEWCSGSTLMFCLS